MSRRVYIAEALDLWICPACRRRERGRDAATIGPPRCTHSAPIRCHTQADVALWWRVRLLDRATDEVREIVHVSRDRIVAALERGVRRDGGLVWARVAG